MANDGSKRWWVYLARCGDGSLYCGSTTDLERRMAEHNGKGPGKGAKYTATRRPVTAVWSERAGSRSSAQQRERQIKYLSRQGKEKFMRDRPSRACQ